MTGVCPRCGSSEIKNKYGFVFCHDCGYIIYDYRRKTDEKDKEDDV